MSAGRSAKALLPTEIPEAQRFMPDIAVLGNFVVDLIGKPIDALPERGRLTLIDTLETHPGGNGPNTAGALGKLGADVAVLGRVGDDLYGRFLLERLDGWGVDTSRVGRDDAACTGVTIVPVDSSGERSFIHAYGANAVFSRRHVDWSALEGVSHLHFGSFFVLPAFDGSELAALFREAHQRGMTTSLDFCWDREGEWMRRLGAFEHLDFCMPSEEEARHLTGAVEPDEMAQELVQAGARAAVIKLGERGCIYADRDIFLEIPAFEVEARDTTGAGDCFIAGFLYALQDGWDLDRGLRIANACGARSVQAVGAVTGTGPAAEIEAWAATARLRSN
jgi:sugar/nucleoside kinase (ribokinase family)